MLSSKQYSILMIKWAKRLFPLCRSLTGSGTLETLNYFKNIHTDLKIKSFNSGKKVFDWEIPLQWEILDAYIEHIKTKKRFAEFKKSNLHILGYSTPINKIISKTNLLKNIYTLKNQPDLIPYVTSYYKKRWGFCMSQKQKKLLPRGKYRVFINSKLFKGKLNYAELIIIGKTKKEILISTNVCHPSMANNELSGPVLSIALIDYIKKKFKNNYFTYRFIFIPETIGSIAYLSKEHKIMKKKIIAGFVLSCVGDELQYSHISSRKENTISDLALSAAISYKRNFKYYSFTERGSDERQFCAPGIDLPVCGFCKSKYLEYKEYHTNADNFKLVTKKGLEESFIVMSNIIQAFENTLYPKTQTLCEPMLSKKNLYPSVSKKDLRETTRINIIAYSDGLNSVFEIALKLKISLSKILEEINILKQSGLIK